MLCNISNGVFVEIGTKIDYTEKLLKEKNWSGFLIEKRSEDYNIHVKNSNKMSNMFKENKSKTFLELCARHKIHEIDYLHLDGNDSEFDILKSLDKINVKYFDIRKSRMTKKLKKLIKDNNFKFYISKNGYEYYMNKRTIESS